jgi:hypothetical protein
MRIARRAGWRRGVAGALAGVLALGLAAAGGGAAQAVAAGVPWARVGPGWVLAEYWPARELSGGQVKAAAPTLYLIDPAGLRYVLHRWPATKNPPYVLDWSGDKTRALIGFEGSSKLEQLTLATGQASPVRLPAKVEPLGYTRPTGQGLLGLRAAGSRFQLARYSLTGSLVQVLATGPDDETAVYSPSGQTLAVAGATGVQLVSNSGGVLRTLPVPGTGSDGCLPARWWNATTILATCVAKGARRDRLWLVPASGARPAALTAQHGKHSADPGDLDAWRLSAGLYLQSLKASGSGLIFRQAAGAAVRPVTVPATSDNNWILAADGARLLIGAETPCWTSRSLLWFSPSTGKEQFLFKTPHKLAGVLGDTAYGQPVADTTIFVSCAASARARPTRPSPGGSAVPPGLMVTRS